MCRNTLDKFFTSDALWNACVESRADFPISIAGGTVRVKDLANEGFSMKVSTKARYSKGSKVTFYQGPNAGNSRAVYCFRVKENLADMDVYDILSTLSCYISIGRVDLTYTLDGRGLPLSPEKTLSDYSFMELIAELNTRIPKPTRRTKLPKAPEEGFMEPPRLDNVINLAEKIARILHKDAA